MSRSLRSYEGKDKEVAIQRRLKQTVKGLGYYAAVDASKHHTAPKVVEVESESTQDNG